MNRTQLTSFNIVEIPRRVMLEALDSAPDGECADVCEDCTLLQIRFLILTYVALTSMTGLPPYPAMLLHMGWPGQVLHVLFSEAEPWQAFRTLVERSHNIPRVTPLTEDDVAFGSLRHRLVYRALRTISGVTHVGSYPLIPGGVRGERASFLVSAATGLTAFVEVAMDTLSRDGQRVIPAEHHDVMLHLAGVYRRAGVEPVMIWHTEVDAPRNLADRLNDLRARLGLPTRPPSSPTWYEEIG